jgi:hypothetical protein
MVLGCAQIAFSFLGFCGFCLQIVPCLMISKSDADAIRAALADPAAVKNPSVSASSSSSSSSSSPLSGPQDPGTVTVRVFTRERPLACSVCRDDYTVGSLAVELPCHHHYCKDCILPWIQKRANCPLCRFALPTGAPKLKDDLQGPESNHAQLQRDMFT